MTRWTMALGASCVLWGCWQGDGSEHDTEVSGMVESEVVADTGAVIDCVADTVRPITEPVSEADRVFNSVQAAHHLELDDIVGQYARGDSPLYEGTFQARDNYLRGDDGDLRDGDVLASIVLNQDDIYLSPDRGVGHTLTIFRSTSQQRMQLTQAADDPHRTLVSLVTPYNSSFGVTGACLGCLVDLSSRPDEIVVNDIEAVGTFGTGEPLRVEAAGQLIRIPLVDLTIEDILAVNVRYNAQHLAAIEGFVREGAEYRQSLERRLVEEAPIPVGSAFDTCQRTTRYRVERYVDAACLVRYGIRHLEILSAETCCAEGGPVDGSVARRTECFDS